MGTATNPRLHRFLPQVILATAGVMVVPILAVWMVRASGAITSMLPLIALGTAISLLIGWIGRWAWESRPGAGDLLFGELMIWGFVRRWRNERRLASAAMLLGLDGHGARVEVKDLSRKEQAELLEQLANSLEARDAYTSGHSRRVARHSAMIAKKMGLSPAEVAKIRTAGVLHDVGKIDTPYDVLNKPGRLTDDEFDEIKKHPLRGAEMMIERHLDPELAAVVAHHHERLDGKGYPDGLRGDDIPLGARIIAVADTFDALTSTRPYRSARPHKRALRILNKEAGTQLDPDAVRAFSSHYSGMRPIALWAFFTGLPQRVFYPLFGEGAAGGAISAAKVMAATAAAVGAGSAVAATSPVIDKVGSPQAVAAVASTPAANQMTGPPSSTPANTGAGAGHGNSSNSKGHSLGSSNGSSNGASNGSSSAPGRNPSSAGGGSSDTGTSDPATGGGGNSGSSGKPTTSPGNSGSSSKPTTSPGNSGSGGGSSSGSGGGSSGAHSNAAGGGRDDDQR